MASNTDNRGRRTMESRDADIISDSIYKAKQAEMEFDDRKKALALQREDHSDDPQMPYLHYRLDSAVINCYRQLKKYLKNSEYWNNPIYSYPEQNQVIVLGEGNDVDDELENHEVVSIEWFAGRTVTDTEPEIGDTGVEQHTTARPVFLPEEACKEAIDVMDEARMQFGFAIKGEDTLPTQGFGEVGSNYYDDNPD